MTSDASGPDSAPPGDRADTSAPDLQREKLAKLGTLMAGVAHELSNPAAAVERAADQLRRSLEGLHDARERLDAALPPGEARQVVSELEARARSDDGTSALADAVGRGDREEEMEAWLADHGLDDPWQAASSLAGHGFDVAALEALAERVGRDAVGSVAGWLAHTYQAYGMLDEVRRSATQLVEIAGALRAYARPDREPVPDLDVNEGIRFALVILRGSLPGEITVHLELADDLPPLEGHRGQLIQVWTNLIDNAADALEGRGEIRVRSRLGDDGRIRVEVEDDGAGIPDDVASRVFDEFFTTKPPSEGTGLGLRLSRDIVERHGGQIRFESRPGRTVFTVELPVRRAPEGSGTPTSTTRSP